MGKLILVRHGETKLNADKVYFGRINSKLNEKGIEQAKKAREELSSINYDAIYCSPMLRAKETVEICNYLNLPIKYDNNLRELDFGILEGHTFEELKEKFPESLEKMEKEWETYNYETGEAPIEMYNRSVDFLKTLDFEKDNLIVSHWGVINCILSHYLSNKLDGFWKFRVRNASIIVLKGNLEFCYLEKFL